MPYNPRVTGAGRILLEYHNYSCPYNPLYSPNIPFIITPIIHKTIPIHYPYLPGPIVGGIVGANVGGFDPLHASSPCLMGYS